MTPDEQRYELLLRRLIAVKDARDDLLAFTRLMMPVPGYTQDPDFSRYDAQRFHRIMCVGLEELEKGTIRRLIISLPPRHGKEIYVDTPIITPDGWRRHGDLCVGDYVFGLDGKPALITHVTAPTPGCVPITFSNGEVIWCDPEHLWTARDRSRGSLAPFEILEAATIQARGLWIGIPGKRGSRAKFQLPDVEAPLAYPRRDLPIDPYFLGVWLGNGNADGTVVAFDQRDRAYIDGCAFVYPVRREYIQADTGVAYASFGEGENGRDNVLRKLLAANDLLNNKHVPDMYLRSSVAQRMQLLAGLIDTDGHVEHKTGRVRFVNTNERLIDAVFDLAAGLGYRPYITQQDAALSSSGIQGRKTVFTVGFQPTEPFGTLLLRKQPVFFSMPRRISFRDIGVYDPSRLASCIKVDREDGLYLVGRSCIPTHNTELASKKFPAWFVGKNPAKSLIFGTYNEKFGQDIGRAVRDTMLTPAFAQVFPDVVLKQDSLASDRLQTRQGGIMAFVGRGGTTTGRGGDVLIIDDPLKDRHEADSPTIRDTLWTWFTQVIASRLMDETGRILLIQTRWHQDDLVGRLTDPTNSYYDPEEAAEWKIIDMPALAVDAHKDPLKRSEGDPLWPGRFGRNFLLGLQRRDARGFSALYQGRPSPAGGTFFSSKWIQTYRPAELPTNLRIYAASDHAVSMKQDSDKTCLMCVGVDEDDNIWVLGDLLWRQMTAEQAVEAMLRMMRAYKPVFWWAERSMISKSIGPFLRKRMLETKTFCSIIEMQPIADKQTRAQSIQGRMSMGKVRFPERAPWWPMARDQMLKFPYDAHDDFVDTLSYVGLGLTLQIGAGRTRAKTDDNAEGTFGWLKHERDMAERSVRQGFGAGGW